MEDDIEMQLAIMESLRLDDGEASNLVGYDFHAFEIVADVAKDLGRANTFFRLQKDWYKDRYVSGSVTMVHDNFQAKEDINALNHAKIVQDALQPAHDAALLAYEWTKAQLKACRRHVRVLKARYGFLTFPDEILSEVLEFAAYRRDKDEQNAIVNTVKAAVTLSHVCSRFRRLLSSSPGLWNRVCPSMHAEAVSTCLARCGPSGVDLFVSMAPDFDRVIRPFLEVTRPRKADWRRFVHCCENPSSETFDGIGGLGRLGIATLADEFPLLTNLDIHYPQSALDPRIIHQNSSNLNFYSTWTLPGLRSLSTENLIPTSFSGVRGLVSFSAKLNFRLQWHKEEEGFPVAAFASFLSSCEVLEAFTLKVENCRLFFEPEGEGHTTMPAVKNITFCFSHCRSAVVKSFLGAVRFPNAEKMHLQCDSRGRPANSDMRCQQLLQEVFSNPNTFPLLSKLELGVYGGSAGELAVQTGEVTHERPVSIPFSNLPSVRELELTTADTFIEYLVETVMLPPLRSLSIVDCRKMELDWFVDLYSRLTVRQTDDGLEEVPLALTIRGCPWERQWREMCQVAPTISKTSSEGEPESKEQSDEMGPKDETEMYPESVADVASG